MSIIYTDNLCDLDKEELKKYKVEQISFPLTFFGNTYRDFSEFDYFQFNQALKTKEKIQIDTITKDEFISSFKPSLEAGQDIIFIHGSAKLFSTTANLNNAIQELSIEFPNSKITTIDSYSVSIAEGNLVKEVARKNIEGATHDELVDFAKDTRKNITILFIADNIENLKAFNKIDSGSELVGGVLGVKPIFSFDEVGRLSMIAKSSGKKKAILTISELVEKNGKNLFDYNLDIIENNSNIDAEALKSNLENNIGKDLNIVIRKCNPIVSFFGGNSILGISFRK